MGSRSPVCNLNARKLQREILPANGKTPWIAGSSLSNRKNKEAG
jgi:hypothetical protein